MIKKLRKKFILINMLLVLLVLAIVFAAVCASTYQGLESSGQLALRMALDRKGEGYRPVIGGGNFPDGGRHESQAGFTPAFTVTVDSDGNIVSSDLSGVTIEDDTVKEAVRLALESGAESGTLPSLGLRFLRDSSPDAAKFGDAPVAQPEISGDAETTVGSETGTTVGSETGTAVKTASGVTRYAFADTSGDAATMRSLIFVSLAVGFGGLAAFFVISVFLSSWALKPVEKAWEQQRRFVADASHELKTPLTVILANQGILLAHQSDTIGSRAKWIESTRDEGGRMKKLVDDLLYLAKSDAQKQRPVMSEVNLSDAVTECALQFEPVAFEAGVEITEAVEPGINITGDDAKIKQLCAILLDNAVKYAGESGRAEVSLSREGDSAVLRVKNTGEPIPASDLPHIFDRFYRSDASRARTSGGYGLGLAIAKTIVDEHRAKIRAESGADGTSMTVTF